MILPLLFWTFLLLAMIGWGRIVRDRWLLGSKNNSAWTLEAIWGLSLTCCFGSFYLALVPGSPKATWWAWLVLGFIYFSYERFIVQRAAESSKLLSGARAISYVEAVFVSLVFASALLMVLKAVSVRAFNCYDDFLAYLPEVRMILDRGDFSSPFSLRRLAAYGGQSILQSFFVLPLKEYYVWAFERAFMLLLGAAFLFKQICSEQRRIVAASFLVFLFLWAEHPYINAASELSGTVLLLGFMATARLFDLSSEALKSRIAVLLGVIACAFSQLRANDFASAVILLAIPFVYELVKKRKISPLVWSMVALGVGIIPGAWMLYRSSGTPFFPVIAGNYDASYGTFDTPDNIELVKYFKLTAAAAQIYAFPILAWAIWSNLRHRIWFFSVLFTSVVILGALAFNLRATYDYASVYRYAYPLISVAMFYTFAELLRTRSNWQWPKSKWEWNKVFSLYLALGLLILPVLDTGFRIYDFGLIDFGLITQTLHEGVLDPFKSLREKYSELQAVLPQDGKIALAVEHPFLFNFEHSQFSLLDVPGCTSPGHGFNTHLSPEQIDQYFLSQGIKYLVFEDPDKSVCQYSRAFWSEYKKAQIVKDFHKYWYPHHLEFFNYLDWKRAHSLVVTKGHYSVVRLGD